MEDDLNFLIFEDNLDSFGNENGRRPQFFSKWKTTSIFLQIEDDLIFFLQIKDDLNFFINGR